MPAATLPRSVAADTGQPPAVIEADGLVKRYGDVRAVDGLSLTVRRGEVYGLLGPNGAGKTTTLRMLVGLVAPTAGHVAVLGAPPGDPAGLARLGALIEAPGLYPVLSGRDNLRVFAGHADVPTARIDPVLAAVGLADRAGDRVATYSQGMKQRLGVAVALLADPDLLILDEPTNGLDPAGMADMRRLVRELGSGGRTVVLSSHLMGEVEALCDRVGVVSRGRLVTEGSIDQLRGAAHLLVRVDRIDKARDLLASLDVVESVTADDTHLRVAAPADAAPTVGRVLVEAGFALHELRPERASLEDVFFRLTDEQEQA